MSGTLGEWEERFGRFERSQMSVSSFCDVEEVSVASFYRWRKKLAGDFRASASEASVSPTFQRVEVTSLDSSVVTDSSSRATKIRIGGGVEIELGTDVDFDEVLAGILRFVVEPKMNLTDRSATFSTAVAKIESSAGGASC